MFSSDRRLEEDRTAYGVKKIGKFSRWLHKKVEGTMRHGKPTTVSTKARKTRKAHFQAHSEERRIRMSVRLCKELREKYGVRSMPIRRDDKVMIVTGGHHDEEGVVNSVYRKKYCIYVDKVTRENDKGEIKPVPIQPSNCMITDLHMDNSRKKTLAKKAEILKAAKARVEARDAENARAAAAYRESLRA
eukprot:Blabericola_migrator_1__81@NODE_101_length_14318_cov_135_243281_g28_i1_p8_GENE_NODE_101_length_14318_cov_135_243281_g28_i1NODE_101_length_14318_cov_135_243281_g28_i1_p8_ORF_typecomplete_len189_score29_23Ribosomal_L26/PF16906_5/7_1e38KOW/PF00467_29/0_00015DUF5053/PF16476_5/0_04_NODE_101_length_14318_cov_135_243281_g28_i192039769